MITAILWSCLNIPYKWGGKNPLTGFDCSGLAEWLLQSLGIDPPGINNAQMLYDWIKKEPVISMPKEGAFCFYGKSLKEITHVAIMINENLIIEAGGGNATTTNRQVAETQGACVRIRPKGHRKDLVATLMPNYPEWVKL